MPEPATPPRRSPATTGHWTDPTGTTWSLRRGPLVPRRTRRLRTEAALLVLGHSAGLDPQPVTALDLAELHAPYLAYEFTDADGRAMLFLELHC
ncbi:hypothetical protein [Kitasatospora sp. NPDC088134]|uniref:hypothetical protein n=1 Tax=Kitasatospora sp. NPDC088134 TaxID=3364071 RepID=UPI0038216201